MGNQNGFDSDEQEAYEYARYTARQETAQQPNIVPCFKCGGQMYQESEEPKENIHHECLTPPTTNNIKTGDK